MKLYYTRFASYMLPGNKQQAKMIFGLVINEI